MQIASSSSLTPILAIGGSGRRFPLVQHEHPGQCPVNDVFTVFHSLHIDRLNGIDGSSVFILPEIGYVYAEIHVLTGYTTLFLRVGVCLLYDYTL